MVQEGLRLLFFNDLTSKDLVRTAFDYRSLAVQRFRFDDLGSTVVVNEPFNDPGLTFERSGFDDLVLLDDLDMVLRRGVSLFALIVQLLESLLTFAGRHQEVYGVVFAGVAGFDDFGDFQDVVGEVGALRHHLYVDGLLV